jgi:hypothetical protein
VVAAQPRRPVRRPRPVRQLPATVEGFVEAVAQTCDVRWSVPAPLLARMVVATTTGVRLVWLVDGDDDAARATLDTFAGVVAGLAV